MSPKERSERTIDRAGRASIRHTMASCPPEAKSIRLHALANRYHVKVATIWRIVRNKETQDDLAEDANYLEEKKVIGLPISLPEHEDTKSIAVAGNPTGSVGSKQSKKPSAKKNMAAKGKKGRHPKAKTVDGVSRLTQSTAALHTGSAQPDREMVVIQPSSQGSPTRKRLRSAQREVIVIDNDVDVLSGSSSGPSSEPYDQAKGRSDDKPVPPSDGPPPAKRARRDQDFASFLNNVGLKRLAPAFADAGFATADELKSFLAYSKTRKEQIVEKLWTAKSINLKDWADFNDALDHSR